MIGNETRVDLRLVRQGLLGVTIGAILLVCYMYASDRGRLQIASVIAGAVFALIPIALAARKCPPASMADIYALSRTSTRSFVMWLCMMIVYLILLQPMGPDVFNFIVGSCVIGLLVSRIVFPIYMTVLVDMFGVSPGDESHD